MKQETSLSVAEDATNSKETWTPGPWEAKPETDNVPAQVWADGRQLAEVYGETRAARQSNARLIAAAPALFAALKDIENMAMRTASICERIQDAARNALFLVDGQQKENL